MKVCMLSSSHDPLDSRIYIKETKSLCKAGHSITIIAPSDNEIENNSEIKIIRIKRRKTNSLLRRIIPFFQLAREGSKITADVYHCHEPDSLLIGILQKIWKRTKVIYDSHEYHPEALAERFPKRFQKIVEKVIYLYEKIISKYIDHIITVNQELGEKFRKYNKNVSVIPNYPHKKIFNINTHNNSIQRNYKNCKVMIYIGLLSQNRGIFEIIKSIVIIKEKLPNVKMVFVGWFNDIKFKNEVESYIALHNLSEYIEFEGKVAHELIPHYLNFADLGLVLLQPTSERYKKSEPTKLFEYMACGIPALVNDFIGVRNIINKEKCGILIDPTNVNQIAEKTIDLLTDDKKRKILGECGKKAFEERYNWESLEKKLLFIYAKLDEK